MRARRQPPTLGTQRVSIAAHRKPGDRRFLPAWQTCVKLSGMFASAKMKTCLSLCGLLLAGGMGGCSIGTRPTATPVTPTPQQTAVATLRATPTVAPTPTPTTTARPATMPPERKPTPTPPAGATPTQTKPLRPTPTLAPIPTPTPRPQPRPSVQAEPAFDQLRAGYHKPGKPVQPVLGWRFPAPGGVSAAPALAEGTIFIGSVDGTAYALDAWSGIERWRSGTRGRIQAAPDVSGDLVYFGSDDGSVYALETRTGRLIWRQDLGSPVRAPLTTLGETVYAATQAGDVYALDARTSQVRWRYRSASPVTGRPIVVRGRVIFSNLDGDVTALQATGGRRLWSLAGVASGRESSASASGDKVFVGGGDGRLAAADVRTGKLRWRTPVGRGLVTTPAIVGDRVLTVAADGQRGRVSSVDARTGKRVWSRPLPTVPTSSPAVVAGRMYVGVKDGSVYAFDSQRGQQLWRYRTGKEVASSPIVADGRMYLGSWDGYFYAIGQPQVGAAGPARVRATVRPDARGDVSDRRLRFMDIVGVGAQYSEYRRVSGVLLETRIAARPPSRSTEQVAYVWAVDNTLDAQIDYYVFMDLAPGGVRYRATLERNSPEGLVTINDQLPYSLGKDNVRVFVPFAPHLSTSDMPPTLEWYAYSYYGRLPAQDEVSDGGRYFILTPEE